MTDIFFLEKKRSFNNSSKAAFYSGNLIHVEADFLDQITFLTLLCEEKPQIYLQCDFVVSYVITFRYSVYKKLCIGELVKILTIVFPCFNTNIYSCCVRWQVGEKNFIFVLCIFLVAKMTACTKRGKTSIMLPL